MKNLFFIALIGVIFASCEEKVKPDSNIHYINMDCVIVEKIPSVESVGRHTSKAFLIRGVKDTTLYQEYIGLRQYMTDSMYYNHEVGDTLHFDYIKKNRFFKK